MSTPMPSPSIKPRIGSSATTSLPSSTRIFSPDSGICTCLKFIFHPLNGQQPSLASLRYQSLRDMVSNRERESRWPTAGLLLLSLLLHAGLLLMPLPNAVSPAPHEASPVIAVRLFAPPAGAGLDEIAEPDDATQREELTETAADSAEA